MIEPRLPLHYLLSAVAESLFVTTWVFANRLSGNAADPAPPNGAITEQGETDATG